MNDLLSIVIPVYNVEKYLEKAVNSVIKQTYKNLEIILVDDGSKDSSGILCDKLAKLDTRIKVIHQENAGLSAARNAGIKMATGNYIGFVDSDDVIAENMYEILYEALIKNDAKIAMCDYIPFSSAEPNYGGNYETVVFDTNEALKELMIDKRVRNFAWNKLYDINLFTNIEFPKGKKYEDVGTTFKLFLEADKLVYVDAKLYGYFIRTDSITGNYNINSALNLMELMEYRYKYLIKEKLELKNYIDMNRVNTVTRYFVDIAKSGKLSVLKDITFRNKLNEELKIAKKLNSKSIKKLNTRKQNLLNKVLLFNPTFFCFMVKCAYRICSNRI